MFSRVILAQRRIVCALQAVVVEARKAFQSTRLTRYEYWIKETPMTTNEWTSDSSSFVLWMRLQFHVQGLIQTVQHTDDVAFNLISVFKRILLIAFQASNKETLATYYQELDAKWRKSNGRIVRRNDGLRNSNKIYIIII